MRSLRPIRLFVVCLGILPSPGHADDPPAKLQPDHSAFVSVPFLETPSLLDLSNPGQTLQRVAREREFLSSRWIRPAPRTRIEPTVRELADLHAVFGRLADPVTPTFAELVARIPFISSADPRCHSIEIDGSIKIDEHVSFTFRTLYRAPDHYALIVRDEPNGPPILFVADRHLLVYDPVRPAILYSDQAPFYSTIRARNNAIDLKAFWAPNSKHASRIELDIPSIMRTIERQPDAVGIRTTVTQTSLYRYLANLRWANGDYGQLSMDFARPCPITRFALVSDRLRAALLTRIAVDEQISEGEFSFPTREQASAIMKVVDCSGDGAFRELGSVGLMLRGLYARLAVRNPELRSAIKLPALIGVDWDKVEKNDRQYSARLRDVFSAARP